MPKWCFVELDRQLLDQVLEIEIQSFNFPWNRSSYIDELNCSGALNRAVIVPDRADGKSLIAYLCCRIIIDELHIMKIAVAPSWRRRGVASALLQHGFDLAHNKGVKKVLLEVRTTNLAAQRLYRHNGFQLIGKRPNYYPQTGEAALLYMKKIEESR